MARKLSTVPQHALNAICPYYAMFPLEFPMRLLRRFSKSSVVLDVFCGRGTTNYAARASGMKSYGIDSSPVAVAIAQAKCAHAQTSDVLELAKSLVSSVKPKNIPTGEFWKWAFGPETLEELCALREGLLQSGLEDEAVLLRALCLGCLHGPRNRDVDNASYFSNQMPRTFASKPEYAVRFWKNRELLPINVDVHKVLKRKARRALKFVTTTTNCPANVRLGDSSQASGLSHLGEPFDVLITSPPYFGLQTYLEDQWLRNWFTGGSADVPYGQSIGLSQKSPDDFAGALAQVWRNVGRLATGRSKLVVRFGSVASRYVDAKTLFQQSLSLAESSWELYRTLPIDTANLGSRQATTMGTTSPAVVEYDFFCRWS